MLGFGIMFIVDQFASAWGAHHHHHQSSTVSVNSSHSNVTQSGHKNLPMFIGLLVHCAADGVAMVCLMLSD
jgi:hypothetical protein